MLSLLRTEAQEIRHRRFLLCDAVARSRLPGGGTGPRLSWEGGGVAGWRRRRGYQVGLVGDGAPSSGRLFRALVPCGTPLSFLVGGPACPLLAPRHATALPGWQLPPPATSFSCCHQTEDSACSQEGGFSSQGHSFFLLSCIKEW